MCAQFLEQKLGCHGCYGAPTVQVRAAGGQGAAPGTASCLCHNRLPAAKAKLVPICLQEACTHTLSLAY